MVKILKSKKAFTLTELIIVIAIIGILSVVMVPVLTGCIEDAKISNDTVLVANINKVLAANKILDGRNDTAYDAINDAFEAGYGIDKLTPTSNKCYFMWDAKYDEFILTNESFGEIYPKNKDRDPEAPENLFGLAANKKDITKLEEKGHSIYLKDNFPISEIAVDSIITIHSGLDIGNNTGIEKVLYQNEEKKDVIIRTNGGKLEINAPLDTVKHYGFASMVNIKVVDYNSSYHEYGYTGYVEIVKGHFVVEETGKVDTIVVTGSESVKVDNNNGKLGTAYTSNEETENLLHGGNVALKKPVGELLKTVTTWSELKMEVENNDGAPIVRFEPKEDITSGVTTISIGRAITILGNGKKISCEIDRTDNAIKNVKWRANGLFNITAIDAEILIDGFDMINTATGRGSCINFNYESSNVNVSINNSSLSAKYSICSDVTGYYQNLTLNNVKFGNNFNAIYWRANYGNIIANNCELTSLNTFNGTINRFATIALDGAYDVDLGNNFTSRTENNTFIFNNCDIESNAIPGEKQDLIKCYSSYNNKFYLNNCKFNSEKEQIKIAKHFSHVNDESYPTKPSLNDKSTGSYVYINGVDGEKLSFVQNVICKFADMNGNGVYVENIEKK